MPRRGSRQIKLRLRTLVFAAVASLLISTITGAAPPSTAESSLQLLTSGNGGRVLNTFIGSAKSEFPCDHSIDTQAAIELSEPVSVTAARLKSITTHNEFCDLSLKRS